MQMQRIKILAAISRLIARGLADASDRLAAASSLHNQGDAQIYYVS
jgi:hypothetical protein